MNLFKLVSLIENYFKELIILKKKNLNCKKHLDQVECLFLLKQITEALKNVKSPMLFP